MKISGAQILVESLIDHGVTDVFGYPGGQVLAVYDALYKARNRIRHIITSHEQGAAHCADGYARTSGKVGVVIATSGPGATNLVTGIATAMLDSVPLVAITGNVSTDCIGTDGFQEVDITGITMPITKHNFFVSDVNRLSETVDMAFRIAKSGRPGPVLIDIPKDVQEKRCEYIPFNSRGDLSGTAPFQDYDAVSRAADLLNSSQRPYIYIGGGSQTEDIRDLILKIADKSGAYIGCSLMGISVVPHDHPRFLGMQGMFGRYASSMAFGSSDVILAAGVRFSDRSVADKKNDGCKIIHIDIDCSEINKNIPADIGIVGDLNETLGLLSEKLINKHPLDDWDGIVSDFRKREDAICREASSEQRNGIFPKDILSAVNELKSDSTVIVTDVGQHQMWTAQYISLNRQRKFLTSGGLGTMGYGLGASIGASVAEADDSPVVLITGDGSLMMSVNELATAVRLRSRIIIVLMNNGVLGMVHQWQRVSYGRRYSESKLKKKTDFVSIASAFGAESERVSDLDGFRKAFSKALDYSGPYLIEVPVDENEPVIPLKPYQSV